MIQRFFSYVIIIAIFCSGCSVSKNLPVSTKLSPSQLKEDFSIVEGILKESHPSLDWFTPADSLDLFFQNQKEALNDSLSILQFKHFISSTLTPIKCAHTSCNFTKVHLQRNPTQRILFPFSFRAFGDTLVTNVVRDSSNKNLITGTIITRINEYSGKEVMDILKNYVQSDGYNETGKWSQLNTGTALTTYFHQIISPDSIWNIEFINRFGQLEKASYSIQKRPIKDSIQPKPVVDTLRRSSPSFSLNNVRSLQIDTVLSSAYMTVNTFKGVAGLNGFFRKSFKSIQKHQLENLVIDLRRNGGGLISTTIQLLKYTKDQPFHMVQENYAISTKSSYKKYITNYFKIRFINLFSTKDANGKYHLSLYEKVMNKPKKKNHFNGNIYVLTGGLSYSASALFAQQLKGQSNVTIVGEESGGGGAGTTAMIFYKVVLPNSKIGLTVPLYRTIIDKELAHTGRGVIPDVIVPYTINDFRMRRDPVVSYLKNILTKSSMD